MTTDFYCNQKFWFLSVNLEKFKIYSCCAATPQKIDINWLRKNPGQIFNTPEIIKERKLMLADQPVPSCSASCWKPEAQGLPSKRTIMFGNRQTHTSTQNDPEHLHLIVGSDCNLTCVYCCKFYSSAWTRDVANKPYPVIATDDRFIINTVDQVLASISQKEIEKSESRKFLLEEIDRLYQSPVLKQIIISGGEPFLYLDLARLMKNIPKHVPVEIYTGLGVDEKRFEREIEKLSKNVTVVISAESVGPLYEFVRYGNTWKRFNNNIATLRVSGLKYRFNATVSNLTLIGLKDFINYVDAPINFDACLDPDYLSISVLDTETKNALREQLTSFPEFVAHSLDIEPTHQQKDNFKNYLQEFASRRNLSLDIFPKTLISWIEFV